MTSGERDNFGPVWVISALRSSRVVRAMQSAASDLILKRVIRPSAERAGIGTSAVSNEFRAVTNRNQTARMASKVPFRTLRNAYWTPLGPQFRPPPSCGNLTLDEAQATSLPWRRPGRTVQNFDEFGKAFGYKKGQPMMPKHSCRVW
jgi:hypothetical protein